MPWNPPPLSVTYGPYIKPDVAEQLTVLQMVQLALGGGPNAAEPVITRELALQAIKAIFGIDNVAAVLKALEKENQERADAELEQTTAEQKSLHDIANQGGDSGGGPSKRPGAPKGGGGGAASAGKGKK